jgi:hypothetical protein
MGSAGLFCADAKLLKRKKPKNTRQHTATIHGFFLTGYLQKFLTCYPNHKEQVKEIHALLVTPQLLDWKISLPFANSALSPFL